MADRVFREGALVQIAGSQGKLKDLTEGADEALVDVSGKSAQLLHFDNAEKKWMAQTFDGLLVKVDNTDLEDLKPEDVQNVDLVIGQDFDNSILVETMIEKLTTKGYFVNQYLLSQKSMKDMQAAADKLSYNRIPSDFEPYYLGRDSKEKQVLLDFEQDSPDVTKTAALSSRDALFGSLCSTLSPYLEDTLGIQIATRTNLMVRRTFLDDEEEGDFPNPADPTSAERESFMSLMKRKRVCLMQFLGPLTGKLTLIPKAEELEGEEIEIDAAPGVLVAFLTECFQYSHSCAEGATLAVQSWLLGQRPEFQMEDIGGDMEVLGGTLKGAVGPTGETVAVNGMSVTLGCDSKDYVCYWLTVNKSGGDTFVEIPQMRWDIDQYCLTHDMQNAQVTGRSYTKHQGFIDGVEYFDAKFFNISSAEAGSMDPNQRKTIESTYEALNMAGHDLKSLQREPKHIGVFVGISGSEWGQVPHPLDTAGCGGHEAIISNRCNFAFNLKGASQTINTACSAGLVAMHTGKLHLKFAAFDPLEAVVGAGVNMAYSPLPFVGCCGGGMLSFKGRSFTFDVSADGYGRGEGITSVYMSLAPLNPETFALVAGSQANQDGRSASITAPNGPSQEKCIKAAFREAGLKPPEVDCFECHGTGTALGDPIEVGAFKRIYNAAARSHSLMVTTSKTNLGHLEGGAGMAGFVKCCLQTMKAEGSPNLHLREQNPHLDIEGFPAWLITEPLVTHYDSAYCGVSSFGFGGTNSHAMAYGKNTTTSRGSGQRDFKALMRDKISKAPPPEILVFGDDPEEWETSGMPIEEDKIGKMYQVEMLEDGKTIWREIVGMDSVVRGERFYVSGTSNDWGMLPLEPDLDIPSLYCAEITLSGLGEELFNIICDEDPNMVYYPAQPRCTRKVVPIIGPERVQGSLEDSCWSIVGEPGSCYRVEFFLDEHSISVSWIRRREAISS